jgi:hypothetical protein
MSIDPSKLKPFRTYNGIELRKLSDREISWKPFVPREILGGHYIVRSLRDNDDEFINSATLWQRGFPEIYGGPYDFLLYPEKYRDIFGYGKDFLEGEWFSFVVEYDDDLVGSVLLHMDRKNMSIGWSLATVDPLHRHKHLFRPIVQITDEVTNNSGAEYAYIYGATFHEFSQILALENGFTIRGIIPGFILAWIKDDRYYRHPVVYMDKFYNGGEKMSTREMRLVPHAKELWDLMCKFEKSK